MKLNERLISLRKDKRMSQQDLAEALNNKTIASAGLDVLSVEPMQEDNPLRGIKDSERLLITPHIAWAAKETRQRLMDIAVENLSAYVHGKPIHVVNLKSKG